MMASQSYTPALVQAGLPSNSPSRNVYRVNPALNYYGGSFGYPSPHQNNIYLHPELNGLGMMTPPTSATATFSGSPHTASPGYASMPSTAGSTDLSALPASWPINALALSSMNLQDGSTFAYAPQPIVDPTTCAAPQEVFSSVPLHSHDGHSIARPDSTTSSVDSLSAFSAAATAGANSMHNSHIYPKNHISIATSVPFNQQHHHARGNQQAGMVANGQPPSEVKKRSRTAQACERCRIRKARCFGGNPCNRCTKRRFACEFSTAVRQRGPNKPKAGNVTSTSAASLKSTNSPSKTRRHSISESSSHHVAFPSASGPHIEFKGYGGNPSQLGFSSSGNSAPIATSLPTMSFLSSLTTDYLSVPPTNATFSRPHSDSSLYSSMTGTRSPIFAFTPDPLETNVSTGRYGDYPYTPISPHHSFSPPLAMSISELQRAQANASSVNSFPQAMVGGQSDTDSWYQST